jgi:hypothetical protein
MPKCLTSGFLIGTLFGFIRTSIEMPESKLIFLKFKFHYAFNFKWCPLSKFNCAIEALKVVKKVKKHS